MMCFSTEDSAQDTTESKRRRGHKGQLLFHALAVAEHPPEEVVPLVKKYEEFKMIIFD